MPEALLGLGWFRSRPDLRLYVGNDFQNVGPTVDQHLTNIFHTIFCALMISTRPFVDNVELSSPEVLGFGDSGVEVFLAPVRTAELSVASEMGTTLALPSPRGVGFLDRFLWRCFRLCPFMSKI